MSINLYRTTSCPMTTECSVKLDEIFNMTPNSHIPREGNREELPNTRISINLFGGVQDFEGLRRELEEDGMEVKETDDILCVSGYVPRSDYNYREVRATVAKYRRSSKSWSM